MAAIVVNTYGLVWSVATNRGAVNLQLADGEQGQIPVDSPVVLAALGDILRTSHGVTFDSNGQIFATLLKPVGTV